MKYKAQREKKNLNRKTDKQLEPKYGRVLIQYLLYLAALVYGYILYL